MKERPINHRATGMTGGDYPIIQAPLDWIARARPAASVSSAGGPGIRLHVLNASRGG